MGTKSICDKCTYRWSSGGKLFCRISQWNKCQYSSHKKECSAFEEGRNDKDLRRKDGSNRKGRSW